MKISQGVLAICRTENYCLGFILGRSLPWRLSTIATVGMSTPWRFAYWGVSRKRRKSCRTFSGSSGRPSSATIPPRGVSARGSSSLLVADPLDRLRSKRRRPRTEPLPVDSSGPLASDNPEESAFIAERRGHVLTALGQLPSAQRQALELSFYQGMTHREIAERLDEPLGTVKSRIKMAMDKLKLSLRGVESTS